MYCCLRAFKVFGATWLVVLLSGLCVSPVFSFVLPDTGITTCFNSAGNVISCPAEGQPLFGQDGSYGPGAMTFANNGNGTTTDVNTGLIWELKDNPDPSNFGDSANLFSWSAAQTLVSDMNSGNYLGFNDWRLPSSEELDYLVDLSVTEPGPTIDTDAFPNTRPGKYWTAEEDSENAVNSTNNAWVVDFSTSAIEVVDQGVLCYVRVVRGVVQ